MVHNLAKHDDSMSYYKTPKELSTAVQDRIVSTETVMDVGCGLSPMTYFKPKLHILVEPWHEYSDILASQNAHNKSVLIIRQWALEALKSFADNSVDSIFLIDVIEHMEKDVGFEVLKECERVARNQVIIFTPLGFMPQEIHDKDAWGLSGGSVQEHKSGWLPEDFCGNWEFHICEKFHTHDFANKKLPKSYGAFYAILNLDEFVPSDSIESLRAVNRDYVLEQQLKRYQNFPLIKIARKIRQFLLGLR